MPRLSLALSLAIAVLTHADDAGKISVELMGKVDPRGLPMAECDTDVHGIKLVAKLDKKGVGSGTLTLDSTPNPVDEFGNAIAIKALPPVQLECTVKLVKTKKVLSEGPPNAPAVEVEWQLYEITGPKIVSKLSLAREARADWAGARFVWETKDGKNRTVVHMQGPESLVRPPPPPPPCHPGCFPAGTLIQTPGGTRNIEDLRKGDAVTTIDADGKSTKGTVSAMFVTKNRLVEVDIEGKTLLTTATQPLSLADGKLKAAGELKAGDRIHVWVKGEQSSVAVKSVVASGREVNVYNVVLGEPTLFIANGFVARSKPPAVVSDQPIP